MQNRHIRALMAGVALYACGGPAVADEILGSEAAPPVKVEQVQLQDSTVRGVIVNQSDRRIEDLTLRVSYSWRWNDEQQPGNNNPGWSTTGPVTAPLAPGESREFEFVPERPMSVRPDGSYSPAVSVVGYTAYGPSDSAQMH